LHGEGRDDGTRSRIEYRQDGVTGRVDDTASVGVDLGHEYRSCSLERGDGSELIQFHQPRVAGGIRGKNGGQSLSPNLLGHRTAPSSPSPAPY
jgi:hypothetical protein